MTTDVIRCRNCIYWSEMVAHSDGGPVKALCLVPQGEFRGKMKTEIGGCESGIPGRDIHGAVDDPVADESYHA